jgi:hypothetical protein
MTTEDRVNFVLERIGQMPSFDEGAIKRVLASEFEQLERQIVTMQTALQAIAQRGIVFDAKGTWSQEVYKIASAALATLGDK